MWSLGVEIGDPFGDHGAGVAQAVNRVSFKSSLRPLKDECIGGAM